VAVLHGRRSSTLLRLWCRALLRLWCPVFDGIFSYRTMAVWRSHLGNPQVAAINGKGRSMLNQSSSPSASTGARFKEQKGSRLTQMGAAIYKSWFDLGVRMVESNLNPRHI
jgi:hypothetical protein